jgi:folylpolyglutamate synthase/dihydropteroate synthase
VELLRTHAKKIGAPFYTLSDILTPDELLYRTPLNDMDFMDIDNLNTDIARAGLRLLKRKNLPNFVHCFSNEGIEEGLKVRPSCRFETLKRTVEIDVENKGVKVEKKVEVEVILDIAHNQDAVVALVKKINGLYPNRFIRVVLGISADKDLSQCLTPLLSMVGGRSDRIHCVAARQARY